MKMCYVEQLSAVIFFVSSVALASGVENISPEWVEEFKAFVDKDSPHLQTFTRKMASLMYKQTPENSQKLHDYLRQFCSYYSEDDQYRSLSPDQKRYLLYLKDVYLGQ